MTSKSESDDYLLSRDYVDCARLNLQHYLWTEMFGYMLHPDVPRSDENLKVADIGTGTGIWLSDLSRQVSPASQLDGFDIDSTQAAPKQWLPPNVQIRNWDVTTEVPSDLMAQYDVVHIRLFIFVVRDDPRLILRNLIKMLKPGGWLQWAEPDLESMAIVKTDPSNSAAALGELYRTTASQDSRLRANWVSDLPALFVEEGLEHVNPHRCVGSDHHSYAMHECNLLIYDMIMQRKGSSAQAEKISGLLPEALRESREGAMIRFERLNVVGRKLEA